MLMVRVSVLIVCLPLVLGACGEGSDDGESTTSSTTSTTAIATITTGARFGTISLGETPLGSVLVDQSGRTLYVFTNDSDSESTCYDSCAASWPPVIPVGVYDGLEQTFFTDIERSDGTLQMTVRGQPLYTFAGDSEPGQANGQGINGVWFVVGADGRAIGIPSEANGSS